MEISVVDLRKTYGDVLALDIPSLNLESGESFGLVGNNGAGKTTFLRLVLDLVEATTGHVEIGNETVSSSSSWKGRTGAFVDAGFLIGFLTPEEYFQFIGRLFGMSKAETNEATSRLRPLFNDDVLDRGNLIRDLSLGNQKKVGIAGALLTSPALLVLDEPFANLDPTSQYALRDMLRAISEAGKTTMIVSSHDLNHVVDICDRIAVLERGRILSDTATSDSTLRELESYFGQRGR